MGESVLLKKHPRVKLENLPQKPTEKGTCVIWLFEVFGHLGCHIASAWDEDLEMRAHVKQKST